MCGSRCCYSMLRAAVCSANLLLVAVGVALTGLGTWLLVSEHLDHGTEAWDEFWPPGYAVLFLGLVTFLLAFLACCGALTSSKCLLALFLLSVLALLCGEAVLAVMLYFQWFDYRGLLGSTAHQLVRERYTVNTSLAGLAWDQMQAGLECCGASGPIDWAQSAYNGQAELTKEIGIGSSQAALPFSIPPSCCRDQSDPLCSSTITPKHRTVIDENIYFTEGCVTSLLSLLGAHKLHFIMISVAVLVIGNN